MVVMVFSIAGGTVKQRAGLEKPTWRQDLVRERQEKQSRPCVRPGFIPRRVQNFCHLAAQVLIDHPLANRGFRA
jgi:hypothetical protein